MHNIQRGVPLHYTLKTADLEIIIDGLTEGFKDLCQPNHMSVKKSVPMEISVCVKM